MLKKIITDRETSITYYQKGNEPELLIHSGLHGDENSVIPIVQRIVRKYENFLPNFIFVPEVSPSAVALKTRRNVRDFDINRNFLDDSIEPEVLLNMELVKSFHFRLLVSFHEDVELDSFYIYDSKYPENRDRTLSFCKDLETQGISLFTGIDDPSDPAIGYTVVKGHALWTVSNDDVLSGTFDDWAIKRHLADRLILPEIPTSLSSDKKEIIIENIFRSLILPVFEYVDVESQN